MKFKLLFFFLFLIKISYTQEIISGTVLDDFSKGIQDCHIFNLNSKKGVISDEKGRFNINVNPEDVLRISHIEFKTKMISVSKMESLVEIRLLSNTFELDEVVVGNKLTGSLSADIKQVPKDTVAMFMGKLRKGIKDIPTDVIKKMAYGNDEAHLTKAVPLSDLQFGANGIPKGKDAYAEAKRASRREIKFKERFPKKIKREFGEQFFFKTLKIPRENYYQFLEYCNPLGIQQLYKDGNVLKVIEILEKQSKSYLKIIGE